MEYGSGLSNMLGVFPAETYEGCRAYLRNKDGAVIIKTRRGADGKPRALYGMATAPDGSDYMTEWNLDGRHADDPAYDIEKVCLYPFVMGRHAFRLKRLPRWAAYVAVDKDGRIFAYDGLPKAIANKSRWVLGEATKCYGAGTLPGICEDWKNMCCAISRQPWAKEFVK